MVRSTGSEQDWDQTTLAHPGLTPSKWPESHKVDKERDRRSLRCPRGHANDVRCWNPSVVILSSTWLVNPWFCHWCSPRCSERLEAVAALAEPGCSSQTLSKHGINSSVFAKARAGLVWWEENNNSTRRGWLGGEPCQGGTTSTCVICHEEVVAAAEWGRLGNSLLLKGCLGLALNESWIKIASTVP